MSLCGQRRLWLDCSNAQVDLSLRWAQMSEGTFSHIAVQYLVQMSHHVRKGPLRIIMRIITVQSGKCRLCCKHSKHPVIL